MVGWQIWTKGTILEFFLTSLNIVRWGEVWVLVEVYTLLTALLVFFLRIHGEISTSFFNCVIVLMIALFHDTFLCSIILKTTISRALDGKMVDC